DKSARRGAVEPLFLIFGAAKQNGKTKHEQYVADDGAGNGCFDHVDQSLGKSDASDDQLGGVSKSGVEQSAQALTNSSGQFLRGTPDPARNGNDPKSGANEQRDRILFSQAESQKDRDRNKDEKPVK